MTTPVPTPDAPRPITDPPAELVEGLKGAMDLMDTLAQLPEQSPERDQLIQNSTDFMRTLFPHLDDLTLAAFCVYAATNLAGAWKEGEMSEDVLAVAATFAETAKALAWSLDTPTAPEGN